VFYPPSCISQKNISQASRRGAAAAPLQFGSLGAAHRHGASVRASYGRDADLRVDVEDGRRAALGEGLNADTGKEVVVVLVRSDEILQEHDLLAAVAREGVASAANTRLAGRETGVALKTCLDDGESAFV
jgi:hypothetical protein